MIAGQCGVKVLVGKGGGSGKLSTTTGWEKVHRMGTSFGKTFIKLKISSNRRISGKMRRTDKGKGYWDKGENRYGRSAIQKKIGCIIGSEK